MLLNFYINKNPFMQMKGFFTMCMFTNFTQINWIMQIFTLLSLLSATEKIKPLRVLLSF